MKVNNQQVTVTTDDGFVYKPTKKNDMFMEYWTDPASETFGNVYKSALKSGFSKTYSKNLLNVAPKWLLTYIDRTNLTEEHITQGIQNLAMSAPNSKSPDDTRLKAYELLMKLKGLADNKTTTNINIVQPILAGRSVETKSRQEDNIVDISLEENDKDSNKTVEKDYHTPTTDTHVVAEETSVVDTLDLIPE